MSNANIVGFPKQPESIEARPREIQSYVRISLPIETCIAVTDDGKRCKRTMPQQIAAIIEAYYFGVDSVESGPPRASNVLRFPAR